MATTTKTFATTSTWLCPPGVTSIQVEAWGGGGAGGAGTGNPAAGGGGAGGAYAKKATYTVTPGTTYTVTVAATKTTLTTNTQAQNTGDPSWFSSNDTNGVVAQGGLGGNPATVNSTNGAVAAGSSASSFGDGGAVFKGGDGAAGNFGVKGGAGGGGAGSGGNGGSGGVGNGTGGTGTATGGGNGGTGAAPSAAGGNGSTFGGGGAGGIAATATDRAGGSGAAGQIKLTYTTPTTQQLVDPFNQVTLDTNKWVEFLGGGATTTYATTGAQVNYPASSTATTDGDVTSLEAYDLTGSYATLHFITTPSPSTFADAELRVFDSAFGNSVNYLHWVVEGGIIYAQKRVSSATTTLFNTTFNSTTHAYVRIMESAGNILFDTSSDGVTWTNQVTTTGTPITITAVKYLIAGTCFEVETSPGVYKWNNLNTQPATVPTGFAAWASSNISQPLNLGPDVITT